MRNKRLKIIANAFKYATASMVIGTGFLCLSNYQSSKTNKLSSINADHEANKQDPLLKILNMA